jgi:FAD-dependent monooxygenase
LARPGGYVDPSKIDPETFVSETLGGMSGPVPVKIDEVYVKGRWGSRVAIADSFRSDKGRVFLAGDAGKLFKRAVEHIN